MDSRAALRRGSNFAGPGNSRSGRLASWLRGRLCAPFPKTRLEFQAPAVNAREPRSSGNPTRLLHANGAAEADIILAVIGNAEKLAGHRGVIPVFEKRPALDQKIAPFAAVGPLPDVAGHIHDPKRTLPLLTRSYRHWVRRMFPEVGLAGHRGRQIELVPPGVNPAIRAARGLLPFLLRGKPLVQRLAVVSRIDLGDHGHRQVSHVCVVLVIQIEPGKLPVGDFVLVYHEGRQVNFYFLVVFTEKEFSGRYQYHLVMFRGLLRLGLIPA